MPPYDFICKRCGHCCTELLDAYQSTMTADELEEMLESAPIGINILEWVDRLWPTQLYDYWIDPNTGDDVNKCPWLRFHKAERYKSKGGRQHIFGQISKPQIHDFRCTSYQATVAD